MILVKLRDEASGKIIYLGEFEPLTGIGLVFTSLVKFQRLRKHLSDLLEGAILWIWGEKYQGL